MSTLQARTDLVVEAFDRCRTDRTVLIVNDVASDLLVDGRALRDVTRVLSAHAAASGMPTLRYTLAGGVEAVVTPDGPKAHIPSGIADRTPPTVALDIIRESCVRGGTPHLVVMDYAEHLLPAEQMHSASGDTARIVEQIAALPNDPAWTAGEHVLVLIGRTSSLDHRVARLPGVSVVEIGLPSFEERLAAIELMLHSPRHRLVLADGLDPERAARNLGGIPLRAISAMRYHTSPGTPLMDADIRRHKGITIKQAAGDSLVLHEELLDLTTDIAGVPQARRLLLEEQRRGNDCLRVILAGSAGNGKSRLALAIAAALGVPAISFGRILGRYMGESEDNMRMAIEILKAYAPVVLLMDEIDQTGLGRRGEAAGAEGSEVRSNIRAELFMLLGDVGSQLGISVIGMTNRPDLLDEAALDRFTVLPVLHPTPWESAQIMAIQARRDGTEFDVESAGLALLDARVAFSGRQAVRLLGRGQVHAQEAGRTRVEGADITSSIAESLSFIGAEEERQSLLAIRATSWSGHLPWNAARYFGDTTAAPPPYLEPYVAADGLLDPAALEHRILELAGLRGY